MRVVAPCYRNRLGRARLPGSGAVALLEGRIVAPGMSSRARFTHCVRAIVLYFSYLCFMNYI